MEGWLFAAAMSVMTAQSSAPARPSAAAAMPSTTASQERSQSADHISIDGHVSLMADTLPGRDAVELRPQLRLDVSGNRRGAHGVRFGVDVLLEGLLADRGRRESDGRATVRDAWIEAGGSRADVRVGYGRLVWGRLDEIQPSDVINPIDAAKFLFDGRGAARLPVTFVRARAFASEALTIEAIVVPVFRRGTFDALDEATSPFNLVSDVQLPAPAVGVSREVEHVEPLTRWSHVSGGGRVSATAGRVDIAAGVFRGFEGFGVVQLELTPAETIAPAVVGRLVERHLRFTMISGDFETVVGGWALRGELAAFTEKYFASRSPGGIAGGRAIDAGAGVDGSAGDVRMFGSLLVHRQWSATDPTVEATDVSLLGSIERPFGRERYRARVFAVVNPADRAGFLRGLVTWNVRDNVTAELSGAVFLGTGDDLLSRFEDRDFAFTRVTLHF